MTYPHPASQHKRLHFARSRDFRTYEKHLLYLSGLLVDEGVWKKARGAGPFEGALRRLPAQAGVMRKSLDNTFTEVTTLFSLITTVDGYCEPSPNAVFLTQSQDFPEFFTDFLLTFQFPGGHVKPATNLDYVRSGIDLKPGPYIVRVLAEGNRLRNDGAAFGVDRREVTWYILNDLEVSSDGRPPSETAQLILEGRETGVDLGPPSDTAAYGLPSGVVRTPSDFNRYGRDCLSFLLFAGVVTKNEDNRRYYLRHNALARLSRLLRDTDRFDGYDAYRGEPDVTTADMTQVQSDWDLYANRFSRKRLAGTWAPPAEVTDEVPMPPDVAQTPLAQQLRAQEVGADAQQTGREGEAIVLRHEASELRRVGRDDLARQVKKIPDHFGVGYDIKSFDKFGKLRHIEVKTTRSVHAAAVNRVHLTTNEWRAAEELRESYFVYRVALAESQGVSLSVLQNPVGLYKRDRVNMVPRDGADISYEPDLALAERLSETD